MPIIGIDEVGRGPWAGPLVVGAVILPENKPNWVNAVKDSKKHTPRQRGVLSELILSEATATGLGWVSAAEIDAFGLAISLRLATRRAIRALKRQHAEFSQIIIDGPQNFLAGTPLEQYTSTLVKADDLIKEVSAASIIAKVARDNYMAELDQIYPGYGFAQHKGYGTAAHKAALERSGPCPEHRHSVRPIRQILGLPPLSPAERKNTTSVGLQGELAAVQYLESQGHAILVRNYRTRRAEIDIISILGNSLYFTEVKYRKNRTRGGGLAAVTPAKKRQMEFAAEIFLQNHPNYRLLQPVLAVADVSGPDFLVEDFIPLAE